MLKSKTFDESELQLAREFCKQQFTLAERQSDGSTLRKHLESVEKVTGKRPKELETIELPEVFQFCWEWFLHLNNARPSGGFGASPLLYSEMQAFFELKQLSPEPWEIDIIKMFDIIALDIFNQQQKAQQERDMQQNKKKK